MDSGQCSPYDRDQNEDLQRVEDLNFGLCLRQIQNYFESGSNAMFKLTLIGVKSNYTSQSFLDIPLKLALKSF